MGRAGALLVLLLLAGCGGGGRAEIGEASPVECAPFARAMTGLQLHGAAADWWGQSEGRYAHSSQPEEGGVLVFRRSSRLPSGHVSVVVRTVSDREIRVTQANWVHGRVTRDEKVVDVSPGNDWSLVRVWWAPVRALGASAYAAYGFILPHAGRGGAGLVAGLEAGTE